MNVCYNCGAEMPNHLWALFLCDKCEEININGHRTSSGEVARRAAEARDRGAEPVLHLSIKNAGEVAGAEVAGEGAGVSSEVVNFGWYNVTTKATERYLFSTPAVWPRPFSAPSLPEPLKDNGIKVGEIIGYRCWRVSAGTEQLLSMSVHVEWKPGEPIMAGLGGVEFVPEIMEVYGSGTGVHAWRSYLDARAYAMGAEGAVVVGSVRLSGKVIGHRDGYRAECAEIESLDEILPRAGNQKLLRKLRAAYGVGGRRRAAPVAWAIWEATYKWRQPLVILATAVAFAGLALHLLPPPLEWIILGASIACFALGIASGLLIWHVLRRTE